jgi:formylmethanofuran dehydrogenase subunit A
MFGKSTSMTADAPLAYMLRQFGGLSGSMPTPNTRGLGIIPFEYQDKIYPRAAMGIGLELFLLSEDPWRMVFSTDHPNGSS